MTVTVHARANDAAPTSLIAPSAATRGCPAVRRRPARSWRPPRRPRPSRHAGLAGGHAPDVHRICTDPLEGAPHRHDRPTPPRRQRPPATPHRSPAMTTTTIDPRPADTAARTRRLGRFAGLLYLVVLVTGAPPELLVRVPIAAEEGSTAIATAIRDGADLFRLAAFSDLLNMVAFLGVALVLYGLLRGVHAGAARAMLVFNAVSVTIMALNTVDHLAAWWFATNTDLAATMGVDTADALAATFLEFHGIGFSIAEIFFGLWLFPLGWMLWRTRAVPRPIAGLLMVGTVGYLAHVTATFVSPDLATALTPVLSTPPALAETALLLWLLVKGLALPHADPAAA